MNNMENEYMEESKTHADYPAGESDQREIEESSNSNKNGFLKSLLKDLLVAAVLAILLMQFIKPTIVQQTSMEPTLHPHDYLLLNKQAYRFSEPERGDIVVFHTDLKTETGAEKLLIKRIIGLPGETISIMDGGVYIDGKLVKEDYLPDDLLTAGEVTDYKIPKSSYFVMGDNRPVSNDSRQLGTIAKERFIGKAFVRLYPFNSIALL